MSPVAFEKNKTSPSIPSSRTFGPLEEGIDMCSPWGTDRAGFLNDQKLEIAAASKDLVAVLRDSKKFLGQDALSSLAAFSQDLNEISVATATEYAKDITNQSIKLGVSDNVEDLKVALVLCKQVSALAADDVFNKPINQRLSENLQGVTQKLQDTAKKLDDFRVEALEAFQRNDSEKLSNLTEQRKMTCNEVATLEKTQEKIQKQLDSLTPSKVFLDGIKRFEKLMRVLSKDQSEGAMYAVCDVHDRMFESITTARDDLARKLGEVTAQKMSEGKFEEAIKVNALIERLQHLGEERIAVQKKKDAVTGLSSVEVKHDIPIPSGTQPGEPVRAKENIDIAPEAISPPRGRIRPIEISAPYIPPTMRPVPPNQKPELVPAPEPEPQQVFVPPVRPPTRPPAVDLAPAYSLRGQTSGDVPKFLSAGTASSVKLSVSHEKNIFQKATSFISKIFNFEERRASKERKVLKSKYDEKVQKFRKIEGAEELLKDLEYKLRSTLFDEEKLMNLQDRMVRRAISAFHTYNQTAKEIQNLESQILKSEPYPIPEWGKKIFTQGGETPLDGVLREIREGIERMRKGYQQFGIGNPRSLSWS